VIQTETSCEEGKTYNFTAKGFQGILGDDLYGLYKSEYVNENGEHRLNIAENASHFLFEH